MPEPEGIDEYTRRFMENSVVSGYGIDVAQGIPCPFCAAPDFMTLRPVQGLFPGDEAPNLDEQMRDTATCSECGRSGRNIVNRTPHSVTFEFVQTGGRPAPSFLPPIRRVDGS